MLVGEPDINYWQLKSNFGENKVSVVPVCHLGHAKSVLSRTSYLLNTYCLATAQYWVQWLLLILKV